MTAAPDSTQLDRTLPGRVGQPVIIVILLDILSLGLYSILRSYILHAALGQKAGRQIFSSAFLHSLLILSLAACVMRFSREHVPLDAALILTRFGAALLFVSLLFAFRRVLQQEFGLRIRPLPLGIFGFWYLQHRINRYERAEKIEAPTQEPLWILASALFIYLFLSLLGSAVKHSQVPTVAMEPTLVLGDQVLIDQVSYAFFSAPRRADLLLYTSPFDKKTRSIQRVLGVPGDRISIQGDRIRINNTPLDCTPTPERHQDPDAFDQSPKRSYDCRLDGKKFSLQHYRQGPLTAIDGDFEVPPDHYFVIGDNLDNSADSRTIGAIPSRYVTGHVIVNLLSYRIGESVPWHRWLRTIQ